MARAIAAKSGFLRSTPVSMKPEAFISIATNPSTPLLKITIFHRQLHLRQRDQVAHQHGKPAIARHRDHLPPLLRSLRADGVRHGVGHRAVDPGTDQAPAAVHGEIARRPDRRRADIGREHRIV
jgi:hypothetical protein